MGAPMAGHLLDKGYSVRTAVHRTPPSDELVGKGLLVCGSAGEAVAGADIVILMLPDTADVERVLFGESGIVSVLKRGGLVIDMSSISPIATKTFADRVAELGVDYVDAPVSGGEVGAKAATLSIMAGGSAAAFERSRPLFEAMGRNITHVGECGDGQTAKVANQIIVALNLAAAAEALSFAARAGADPERVRKALLGGFASSRVLEVHGQRMVERTFQPGFRIGLHQKDLSIALASGKDLSMPLPGTAFAQQLFSAAAAAGSDSLDHSAIVLGIEKLTGVSVAREVATEL